MVPSSSGLGHHPLKVEARVRIPLGLRCALHPVYAATGSKYLAWSFGPKIGIFEVPTKSSIEV